MRKLISITMSLAIALLMSTFLSSANADQHIEPLVGLDHQIEAARKQMRTERKLVHASELMMTSEESKAFWPIFNEYSAELQAIGDRKVKLIIEYGENFDHITDEFAAHALDEIFEIDGDVLKVRKKYRKRFKRILPIVKVVRFYQVENKLDAVIDFQLAAQIPLMEQ